MNLTEVILRGSLSVDDDVRFHTHVEILKLFGKHYGAHMTATYRPDNQWCVWFPKLYPNGDWDNRLDGESLVMNRRHEGVLDEKYMNFPEDEPGKRIVFANIKDSFTGEKYYKFMGIFTELEGTFQRASCMRTSKVLYFDGVGRFGPDPLGLGATVNPSNIYTSRKDLYDAGLHNSHQKGIGRAKNGTDYMSIVLSGGYEDDEDFGTEIIYTGEGGRDPSTGQQIANQTLTGGNLGLLKSFESGQPVYVTRKVSSGYEFDSEYQVTEHWIEKGKSGFDVVRFRLKKLDQLLADPKDEQSSAGPADRVEYVTTRLIRDTKISKSVKELYDYGCQVCGMVIELPSGDKYAEGAHIKPLGKPHNGPDTTQNILCLCPNHHLMFDRYTFSINPDTFELEGAVTGKLKVANSHNIDNEFLTYHRDNFISHR